jgi:hypothetical protein
LLLGMLPGAGSITHAEIQRGNPDLAVPRIKSSISS